MSFGMVHHSGSQPAARVYC